ncbi:MAG: SGNH/GDSL hydrolase family protein, partial [Planctomycetaceae bacterium]
DDQDAHHDADGCVRGMEGILRQLWQHNPDAGAVMLHFVNPEMLATAQAGGMQLSAKQHESVARHYGVSSIDLPAALAGRIKDGTMSWETWGGTHPGPAGNRHTADLVIQVLQAAQASAGSVAVETDAESLPEPLLASSFAAGSFLPSEAIRPGAGWQMGIPDWNALPGSKRERFVRE